MKRVGENQTFIVFRMFKSFIESKDVATAIVWVFENHIRQGQQTGQE